MSPWSPTFKPCAWNSQAVRDRSAREAEAAREQAARQGKVAGQVEPLLAEVDRLEGEQKRRYMALKLEGIIKVAAGTLVSTVPAWGPVITEANAEAWTKIQEVFLAKGYSLVQIQAWDFGKHFSPVAEKFQMKWRLAQSSHRQRMIILSYPIAGCA